MGSPEHLHGEVPEPGKGNETSMFYVDDSGRTSGGMLRLFSFRKELLLFLR
jgi:hypothetical protein